VKRRKAKGRASGAAMMVWLFFANLFEPAKVAATEHIDTARRAGNASTRDAATPAGPDKS
jgi:hypothetical protein